MPRLVACLALVCACVALASAQTGTLRLLTDAVSSMGAMCLDGSAPAYYYVGGSGSGLNNWMIFIEGGGWCYSVSECYQRAQTILGSSLTYNTTIPNEDGMTGIWDPSCTNNPTFCNWNKIFVKYCDGTSFTSNLAQPVKYNGANLWFRGRVNLEAVLADLPNLNIGGGWNKAQQVVLSGCSAGGLSTYHGADFVGARLPASVTKYAAIPVSGFFILANNVLNQPIYPVQMETIYDIGNCSGGVAPQCLAANPSAPWVCMFAQNALPYIKTPIFVLNSAFDAWQLQCEYYSDNASCGVYWQNCNQTSPCSASYWAGFNKYGPEFTGILDRIANYHAKGNGGYIDSCVNHCEAVYGDWNSYQIGGVTMQQAVTKWWTSNGAGNNWYSDCTAYHSSYPFVCNPTCNAYLEPEMHPQEGMRL